MRSPTTISILALGLLLGAPVQAQRPAFDAGRLQVGTDSLAIYLVQGNEQRRIGMLWDELRREDRGGIEVLRRVYRTENAAFGPHLDSIYTRAVDFKPVSQWTASRQVELHVVYRADSIVGRRSVDGAPVPIARAADPGLYDGASFDLMVRAAALKEGFVLEVPAYLAAQDSVVRLRARVTGSDRLPTIGRESKVWVVEMDFSGLSTTLWVDMESRALVQQVIRLSPEFSILMTRPELALRSAPLAPHRPSS